MLDIRSIRLTAVMLFMTSLCLHTKGLAALTSEGSSSSSSASIEPETFSQTPGWGFPIFSVETLYAQEAEALVVQHCGSLKKGKLGKGSYSRVYELQYQGLPSVYKKIREKHFELSRTQELLRRELEVMFKSRGYPNLVQLKAVVFHDDHEEGEAKKIAGFITPKYSKNLYQLTAYNDFFKYTLHDVKTWALGILRGMEYLHQNGFTHRDIKPENVVFQELQPPYKTPVLIDFGLIRIDENVKRPCSPGVGTAEYEAPEVIDAKEYDKSIDIYSFGILLWELLQREEPFQEYTSQGHYHGLKMAVVLHDARPNLRKIKMRYPTMVPVLEACWHKEPNQRPSIEELREMLSNAIGPTEESVPVLL